MIKRAWSATCVEGNLRDQFVNAVSRRITQVDNCPGEAAYAVVMAEDFAERCDAIFTEHNPETASAVASLAGWIDTTNLYECVQN